MIFIGDAQGELSFKKAPPKNHYGRIISSPTVDKGIRFTFKF